MMHSFAIPDTPFVFVLFIVFRASWLVFVFPSLSLGEDDLTAVTVWMHALVGLVPNGASISAVCF
jgi:ACR3 family arsenite efflux pump ArsB